MKKNLPKGSARSARGESPKAPTPRVPVPERKKRVKRGGRPRVQKILRRGGPPFDRDFFDQTLPAMVEKCPCPPGHVPIVHVHLGDGSVIDVAAVVQAFERYVVVAAFEGSGEDGIPRTADDVGFDAFPYDLVVRATVRGSVARPSGFGFGQVGTPHGVRPPEDRAPISPSGAAGSPGA